MQRCFKSRPSVKVREFLASSTLDCRVSVMFCTWFTQLAFLRNAISFSRLVVRSFSILRSFWTICYSFVSSTICFTVDSYSNFMFLASSCKERKTETSISWTKGAGMVFLSLHSNFTPNENKNKCTAKPHHILVLDFILRCYDCKSAVLSFIIHNKYRNAIYLIIY